MGTLILFRTGSWSFYSTAVCVDANRFELIKIYYLLKKPVHCVTEYMPVIRNSSNDLKLLPRRDSSAVALNAAIFGVVTPCGSAEVHRSSRGTLLHLLLGPEYGGNTFLRNAGRLLTNYEYIALQPRGSTLRSFNFLNSSVFWDITSCNLLKVILHSWGIYRLHLQGLIFAKK
jgi:hypothetical protein